MKITLEQIEPGRWSIDTHGEKIGWSIVSTEPDFPTELRRRVPVALRHQGDVITVALSGDPWDQLRVVGRYPVSYGDHEFVMVVRRDGDDLVFRATEPVRGMPQGALPTTFESNDVRVGINELESRKEATSWTGITAEVLETIPEDWFRQIRRLAGQLSA